MIYICTVLCINMRAFLCTEWVHKTFLTWKNIHIYRSRKVAVMVIGSVAVTSPRNVESWDPSQINWISVFILIGLPIDSLVILKLDTYAWSYFPVISSAPFRCFHFLFWYAFVLWEPLNNLGHISKSVWVNSFL